MRYFSLVLGADTAGISGRLAEAFKQHGAPDTYRSMVSKLNYIKYPRDLPFSPMSAADLWAKADVIHTNHDLRTVEYAVHRRRLGTRLSHKPYLLTLHGVSGKPGDYLKYRAQWLHRAVQALQRQKQLQPVVSTLDLQVTTGLPWLPAPYDVSQLQKMRRQGKSLKIAHAPTHRAVKSTDKLIAAVDRLRSEGAEVELDIIEGVAWAECLKRKATADIYFDQVLLGYGCNALEAWAMGIPVIAGTDDATYDLMQQTLGTVPFLRADESTVYDAIRTLVESPSQRKQWGSVGHEYVRCWHDYPVVVDCFRELAAWL
jgi:hypothetical protein